MKLPGDKGIDLSTQISSSVRKTEQSHATYTETVQVHTFSYWGT